MAALNRAAGPGGFATVQAELSGGTGDLAAAKSQLVAFFDAGIAASNAAVSDLKKAGVPKVTNGDKIEKTVLGTAQTIQKFLAAGKKKVGTLSTTDAAAFKATGSGILADFASLQKSTQKTDKTIKKLDKDHKVTSTLSACSGGGSSSQTGGGGGAPAGGSGSGGGSGGAGGGGAPPTAPAPAPAGGTGGGPPGY